MPPSPIGQRMPHRGGQHHQAPRHAPKGGPGPTRRGGGAAGLISTLADVESAASAATGSGGGAGSGGEGRFAGLLGGGGFAAQLGNNTQMFADAKEKFSNIKKEFTVERVIIYGITYLACFALVLQAFIATLYFRAIPDSHIASLSDGKAAALSRTYDGIIVLGATGLGIAAGSVLFLFKSPKIKDVVIYAILAFILLINIVFIYYLGKIKTDTNETIDKQHAYTNIKLVAWATVGFIAGILVHKGITVLNGINSDSKEGDDVESALVQGQITAIVAALFIISNSILAFIVYHEGDKTSNPHHVAMLASSIAMFILAIVSIVVAIALFFVD